jgi:hypothetical protein
VLDTTLYVIKFVSDLRQVGGFLRVLWFPPSIKLTTTIYIVTELLLKVVLNTLTLTQMLIFFFHYDCKISLRSLLINTIIRNPAFFLLFFFSFLSKKEVRHCYRGGGGHVFLVNYTLYLSYIFMQKNPIFLYNFCQKWLDTLH